MTIATDCRRLAKLLAERQVKVVFAESCTAGLVSASLARVPGISEFLCGSAVTYRNDTKNGWLSVEAKLLERPGPVSRVVVENMADGVLRATPEADWAASITGHLGPNAPRKLDGLVYIGVAKRESRSGRRPQAKVRVFKHFLEATTRNARQREAVSLVLVRLGETIRQDV
jgi:PncC family amidohydrolase